MRTLARGVAHGLTVAVVASSCWVMGTQPAEAAGLGIPVCSVGDTLT